MSRDVKIVSPRHQTVWVAAADLVALLATGTRPLPDLMRREDAPRSSGVWKAKRWEKDQQPPSDEPKVKFFELIPSPEQLARVVEQVYGSWEEPRGWDWQPLLRLIAMVIRDPNHYVVFDEQEDLYWAECAHAGTAQRGKERKGWAYFDILDEASYAGLDEYAGCPGAYVTVYSDVRTPRDLRQQVPKHFHAFEIQDEGGFVVRFQVRDGEIQISSHTHTLALLPIASNTVTLKPGRIT